jgi:small conductance mechanosensitive channel
VITLELTWEWPDTLITIAVVIGGALLAHFIVVVIINHFIRRVRAFADKPQGTLAQRAAKALGKTTGTSPGRAAVHAAALARLLKSVWTILLVIVTILTVLYTLNIPLAPLLTSAGIGGVILGFGAQSLIKDYLSGISMILEDQFGVGDQITIGDVSGIVEDITLRITKLRDGTGMIWYIRNGEILRVGNVSQGYSTGLIDVPVAYDADVALVSSILTQVVDEVSNDDALAEHLLEPPQVLGVESITATTLTMRILIKTPPNEQFALAREIRERAMAALSAAEVPAPNIAPTVSIAPLAPLASD